MAEETMTKATMAREKKNRNQQPFARQTFHLQFVTTPTADTAGTVLYLHFDDQRYLIGRISEGTQRACQERSVRHMKTHNIFLTGAESWRYSGGLMGLLMTMADTQATRAEDTGITTRTNLNLHGGPQLAHYLASTRRFIFRTGVPLELVESLPRETSDIQTPSWTDKNIRVWSMPVLEEQEQEHTTSDQDETGFSSSGEDDDLSGSTSKLPKAMQVEAQKARHSIIHDMFDSDWRRDRLIKMPFGEVQFPATIYIQDHTTKTLVSHRCESALSLPELSPSETVLIRNPWPASLVGKLPEKPQDASVAMSYIIKGHPQRGKFDPSKAVELGVKMGPAFSALTNGESVTCDDGSVVTPEMVLGPGRAGRGLVVVDLPHRSFISSLLQRPEWTDENAMEGVEIIVWILDSGVSSDRRLVDFMRAHPQFQHIVSSPDTCPNYLAFGSSAAATARIAQICDTAFSVPKFDNTVKPSFPSQKVTSLTSDNSRQALYMPAERGMILEMAPNLKIQDKEIVPFLDVEAVNQSLSQHVLELAKSARSGHVKSSDTQFEPEIITLGTGSASPSKYRNVSAILLRIPKLGNFLFDCGENTLGQLRRMFDPETMDDILVNLRTIWISHLHADHHLGTLPLIMARRAAYKRYAKQMSSASRELDPSLEQLFVVGEQNLRGFLDDYGLNSSYATRIVATRSGLVHGQEPFRFHDVGIPIAEIKTCPVSHCWGALAVSVKFDNGFKFSYSGDCRPSEEFARIGKGSDVLVHEATFDDGMEGDAIAKKHCTTGEALAVAAMMEAKNVILTHFSQRYQKIPVMTDIRLPSKVQFEEGDDSGEIQQGPVDDEDGANMHVEDRGPRNPRELQDRRSGDFKAAPRQASVSTAPANVCVAFDYMRIKVSDIKEMYRYTRAFNTLLEVDPENDDVELANGSKVNARQGYMNANMRRTRKPEESPARRQESRNVDDTKRKKLRTLQ